MAAAKAKTQAKVGADLKVIAEAVAKSMPTRLLDNWRFNEVALLLLVLLRQIHMLQLPHHYHHGGTLCGQSGDSDVHIFNLTIVTLAASIGVHKMKKSITSTARCSMTVDPITMAETCISKTR